MPATTTNPSCAELLGIRAGAHLVTPGVRQARATRPDPPWLFGPPSPRLADCPASARGSRPQDIWGERGPPPIVLYRRRASVGMPGGNFMLRRLFAVGFAAALAAPL